MRISHWSQAQCSTFGTSWFTHNKYIDINYSMVTNQTREAMKCHAYTKCLHFPGPLWRSLPFPKVWERVQTFLGSSGRSPVLPGTSVKIWTGAFLSGVWANFFRPHDHITFVLSVSGYTAAVTRMASHREDTCNILYYTLSSVDTVMFCYASVVHQCNLPTLNAPRWRKSRTEVTAFFPKKGNDQASNRVDLFSLTP